MGGFALVSYYLLFFKKKAPCPEIGEKVAQARKNHQSSHIRGINL